MATQAEAKPEINHLQAARGNLASYYEQERRR